ncbi:MAG TPA: hypothetical protein VFG83_00385 [Kofleriaceae bacterium]|nr:hypothetical protein [Kofleriaceae bacterium]
MSSALRDVHGNLLVVRPPVPVTFNKAGANYKSEIAHPEYSPRAAYEEWLAICDGIIALGGDAVFAFEPDDDRFLDAGDLTITAGGDICPAGSTTVLGCAADMLTGRVFTANGPWVVRDGDTVRAVMPNMLAHRRAEAPYYRQLLAAIAGEIGCTLEVTDNPHRWEGMADVAVIGDQVVLTYAVPGRYDEGLPPKSPRSSREGVAFAADAAGIPESARVYAELAYPHFHGDTIGFGARPAAGGAVYVAYANGLYGDSKTAIGHALAAPVLEIDRGDAQDAYASNSRQVAGGALIPGGASSRFESAMRDLGLTVRRVDLFELFGKAGGGPACATLYLPATLDLPASSPLRYSVAREKAHARSPRLARRVTVDPAFFAQARRG